MYSQCSFLDAGIEIGPNPDSLSKRIECQSARFSAVFSIFLMGTLWLPACFYPRQRKTRANQAGNAAEQQPSAGGFIMNGTISSHTHRKSPECIVPEGVCSLVRGDEACLLSQIMPLVRRKPVRLDLGRVERIDAAGISALITLYRAAREAGRCFDVTNPKPHVREILTLVGLDRFLLCDNPEQDGCREPELAESAA
jgi:ABC-type transporter Mla MlaB component